MNEIRAQEDKACARRGRACLPGHAAVAFASARAEHFLMLRTYRAGAPLLLFSSNHHLATTFLPGPSLV